MVEPEVIDPRLAAALSTLVEDDLTELPPPPVGLWEAIAADVEADRVVVTPLPTRSARRRVPRAWAVTAGAAAAIVAVVAGAVVLRDDASVAPVTTAKAALSDENLPVASGSTGKAVLVDEDGELILELSLSDLPPAPPGVVYEVWLLDAASDRLQTLGLTDGGGNFAVPRGVDPSQFSTVDVSREPVDGQPAHSGDSIVRGTLLPVT